ncbi:MAG TPA: TonB-dependent receptor plug domain-containing protein, partial [Chitinophagaceae bacterium]|nr:TonB-dependent receptor plug domain-containing protein [Chitinophagaceae bacterium]
MKIEFKRHGYLGVILLLLLGLSFRGLAQTNATVTGIIRTESGASIPDATIIAVNEADNASQYTTLSNNVGAFSFNQLTTGANYRFTISHVGYKEQVLRNYAVKASGNTAITVSLVAATNASLDEVIVVGYGTQKRVNATGAVDQITSKNLENRPITNLTQGLQGLLPNLNIRMGDGKPTQSPSYNIRGTTSIGQGGSALVLIDGFEGDPSLINPNDIESVSILKDAASAAIYGARGVFGVVLITTKKGVKGRTSVSYSSNYALKSPVTRPDFVTDGYLWSKMFSEAFVNGDGAFPQNANKTQKFSQAYLNEFKKRAESGQP